MNISTGHTALLKLLLIQAGSVSILLNSWLDRSKGHTTSFAFVRETKKTVLPCCACAVGYACLLWLLLIYLNNKCFFIRVVLKPVTKNNLFVGNANF